MTHEVSNTCLIACPIFEKELDAVLTSLCMNPEVQYLHYSVHNNPNIMEGEIREKTSGAKEKGVNVALLVGKNCKGKRDLLDVAEGCNGKIPQARNCIEILIGKEKTRELQQKRTSIMTPAWIKMINQLIKDGLWTETDARMNLGWYNQILILDAGLEPLDDEMIMEFFDLTQVPIDILPIDLEYFKGVVQDLLIVPCQNKTKLTPFTKPSSPLRNTYQGGLQASL